MERLRWALGRPLDPASAAVFRIGFGLLVALAAARFVWLGWIEALLLAPTFHFRWLPWVAVPSRAGLYGLFAAQCVAGLGIASGRGTRLWLIVWLLSFGYVELLDKTLYLNHYVLLTLLGLTLLVSPAGRAKLGGPPVAAWALWLLRVELGLVYFWAGAAKLNADWLLRGEPLGTWLRARSGMPVVGPLISAEPVALLMSWGGAAYDLLIPALLLWPTTRPLAIGLVIFFHVAVGLLFPIGIFPLAMMLGATLFLDPGWPRRRASPSPPPPALGDARPLSAPAAALWVAVLAVLALFPARSMLWDGDVSWTERGYRFSWRVLLNEKTGMVDYRVVERETGRTWRVMPADELTPLQHQHMRTQPDMIRDYALHLRDQHADAGRDVAVYVDSWASLNGRPAQRMIRSDVDLTQPLRVLREEDWIVPLQVP